MGATFKEIAHKQIKDFKVRAYKEVYNQLKVTCQEILEKAVDERILATFEEDAHNFTGNLLNSIAVALLCRRDVVVAIKCPNKQVLTAVENANVKPAEYTGIGYSGSSMHDMNRDAKPMQKGFRYNYEWDYEGAPSRYRIKKGKHVPAEAEGGAGYKSSIEEWQKGLKIKSDNLFEVHLGYTAPYAEFVELDRKTVKAFETFEDVKVYFEVMGLK